MTVMLICIIKLRGKFCKAQLQVFRGNLRIFTFPNFMNQLGKSGLNHRMIHNSNSKHFVKDVHLLIHTLMQVHLRYLMDSFCLNHCGVPPLKSKKLGSPSDSGIAR